MSFVATGIVVGGGALAAGAGSYLGAQAQNRAGRARNASQRNEDADARNRLGLSQYGPNDYADFLTATGDVTGLRRLGLAPGARGRGGSGGALGLVNRTDPVTGFVLGNLFGKKKKTDNYTIPQSEREAASARFFGKYGSLESNTTNANARFIGDLEANQSAEAGNTRDLDALATQNEQAGQDLQAGEIARINRDGARNLAGANQRSQASLGMLGQTSLMANQLSANSRLQGEQNTDSIQAVRQQALERFQRARQLRIGLRTGRAETEEATGRSLAGVRRGTVLEQAQGRIGLFNSPSFGSRSVMAGAGQSGLGSALGSIGGAAGTIGGFGLGNGGFGAGFQDRVQTNRRT